MGHQCKWKTIKSGKCKGFDLDTELQQCQVKTCKGFQIIAINLDQSCPQCKQPLKDQKLKPKYQRLLMMMNEIPHPICYSCAMKILGAAIQKEFANYKDGPIVK